MRRKMKARQLILFLLPLAVVLFALNSCQRSAVEEPGPFGPSTFSILLSLSANPNVIFAGTSREGVAITVSLNKYDGIPLSGKTIYFDLHDASGSRTAIGFFEGNQSVVAKVTDQNGKIRLTYYGPLASEIAQSTTVYIYATVAGEAKDAIFDLAPVYIIRDVIEINFELLAQPNVIYATSERPTSQIRAILTKADGVPLSGRKVYFSVLSGPGEFSDNTTKTFAYTDEQGVATVTYVGPTKDEIGYDQFVTIRGQPETSTPDYIHKEVDIRIIKGN